MIKKIIGLIICTLFIAIAIYPVIGNANQIKYVNSEAEQKNEISTIMKTVSGGRDNSNVWVNPSPKTIGGTLYERERHAMVYDSSADRTIMFGGGSYNDTWVYNYNDNTWYNMSPEMIGGTLTARSDHAMCYDSDADRTILFGGADYNGFCGDTWVYNFTDNKWYNMDPEVVGGTLYPRWLMRMVYDSSAKRAIMFGGHNNDYGGFNETWAYDYNDNKWYNMDPEVVGGTLNGTWVHSMVYDSSADRTIMFGGCQEENFWTNETWVYDYNDNKWYKMNPEIVGGTLWSRVFHAMAYDSNADRTIMFGANIEDNPFQQLNDTWVYNYGDNTWYNVSYSVVGGTFYTREASSMIYDSNSKKPVLFGGFSNDIPYPFLNDTWIFKYNTENEPPNTPTNPEPTNGSTFIEIDDDISWYCWDPDLDDLTYDVYFEADDPTPDNKVSSNQEETTYDPGTMEYNTTYYWQIVAWDTEGHNTAGPIWHFTTRANNPPNTPSDPNPEDGETGVYITTDLGWTGGDPDGDEVTYDVYFGTSSPPPKVESNQSDTTYDPGLLDFETEYFWQIVAWDIMENSAVGPIWSFTTEENFPPYEPNNPDPADGETDVSIEKLLRWKGGDPNVGDSVTYDVYFGKSSPPPLVAEDLTQTAYDPSTMDLDTTYYWQIISEDSGGLTTEGPIWSFTTEKEPNEPPTPPEIDGPKKGKPGKELCWTFHSEDPNDNDIKYIIDWGDGNSEETDYYPSCTPVEVCHIYDEEGTYIIKAMAEDTKEARSDESTFEVEIPRTRAMAYSLFHWFLEHFPLLEKLLNLLG